MLTSEREVFNGSSDLQRQYDDFANAELRRLHLCRCPCGCGLNCLRIRGYYARGAFLPAAIAHAFVLFFETAGIIDSERTDIIAKEVIIWP